MEKLLESLWIIKYIQHDILKFNLLIILFLSVSIWIFLLLGEKESAISIIDTFGNKHDVPHKTFHIIMFVSWTSHIVAWILTICYYKSHPSRIDINTQGKYQVWCFGTARDLSWAFCSKGEFLNKIWFANVLDKWFAESTEDEVEEVDASDDQNDESCVSTKRKGCSSWCCMKGMISHKYKLLQNLNFSGCGR